MKWLGTALAAGMLAVPSLRCEATSCVRVVVADTVEAAPGALTLADLILPNNCQQLREAAAQVSLGSAPQPGSERRLNGSQIRRLLKEVAGRIEGLEETVSMKVPERIVIRRAGATKSCAEIAHFVADAAPPEEMSKAASRWQSDLNCAAARGIAEDAALELTKSVWNATLQRREFSLRCARSEECVPFLVWVHEDAKPFRNGVIERLAGEPHKDLRELSKARSSSGERLVKPGQTATLTWDQSGIRVVLPVTCLDAGALGQFVRVQFKNTPRILRAEVVGVALLRASL